MRELSEVSATPDAALADAAAALLCYQCEYDLRGLPRGGRCPECGYAIEIAWQCEEQRRTRGFIPLSMASRRWLLAMFAGCIVFLVAALSLQCNAIHVVRFSVSSPRWLWTAFFLADSALFMVGLWLLGTREPGAERRWIHGVAACWIIRASLVLELILHIQAVRLTPLAFVNFQRWWLLFEAVGYALASVLILLRLIDAARRADRPRLRRWLIVLLWLLPIAMVAASIPKPVIGIRPSNGWYLVAHPLLGYAEAITVVPFSALHDISINLKWFAWAGQAVLSLNMITALAASAWMFRRAAARAGRISSSSGS